MGQAFSDCLFHPERLDQYSFQLRTCVRDQVRGGGIIFLGPSIYDVRINFRFFLPASPPCSHSVLITTLNFSLRLGRFYFLFSCDTVWAVFFAGSAAVLLDATFKFHPRNAMELP